MHCILPKNFVYSVEYTALSLAKCYLPEGQKLTWVTFRGDNVHEIPKAGVYQHSKTDDYAEPFLDVEMIYIRRYRFKSPEIRALATMFVCTTDT